MSIVVVCPNCLARFQVKEKYAGKQGRCPKCKSIISVPTLDEMVTIHDPDSPDAADAEAARLKKLALLRPVVRVETKIHPVVAVAVIGAILLAFTAALVLRGTDWKSSPLLLAFGAIVLAAPLVVGGYTFLRNPELEPYQGRELAVRAAFCVAVYAILWGLLWTLKHWFLPGDVALESWSTLFLVGPPLVLGTTTAVLCLDLDAGSGFFHYFLYLGVCVLLRLSMGLSAL
jgi:predicted Zn finger-like uncharacterized protein